MTLNDHPAFRADVLGVLLGDRGEGRIVCLETSACYPDLQQVLPLIGRGIRDPEDLNSGLQGHMYVHPKDTLVVRLPDADESRRALVHRSLELNAEIWKVQAGIDLLTPSTGWIRYVAPGETMLEAALACRGERGSDLILSYLTPQAIARLSLEGSRLALFARSLSALNRKNECMRLLEAGGVPVPRTFPLERQGLDLRALEVALEAGLPKTTRFVYKVSGASSGVGVETGGGRGLGREQLLRRLSELRDAGKLPGQFQVQEFVPGCSMGAISLYDGHGGCRLLTVHEQVIEEGAFRGARWRRERHELLAPRVRELYRRIGRLPAVQLCGPVGIDFQLAGDEIRVIEVNGRLSGTAPFSYLLEQEANIAAHCGRRAGGGTAFRIEALDLLLGVSIPPSLLADGSLHRIVRDALARAVEGGGRARPSEPMILPQGLDPFRPNKVLIVNDDPTGGVRRAFLEELKAAQRAA